MLALSLLVTSRSHIFTSFFKIFLMICLFGLYHGLVMLPVLLCLVGPVDIQQEEDSPANKSELSLLISKKQAQPFHNKVFVHNQFATNFSR